MSVQLDAVERAIDDVQRYGLEHAAAADLEIVLEHGRGLVRDEAVKRLCQPELSADDPPKVLRHALSPTAAEKAVHGDLLYQAHLEQLRQATLAKNRAYTLLISARLVTLLGLVRAATESTNPLAQLILGVALDMGLVRPPDESKDQLRGGVPK
jgi:hypothetical protein